MKKFLLAFTVITLNTACDQSTTTRNTGNDSKQNISDTTLSERNKYDTGATGTTTIRKTGSTADVTEKTGGAANIGSNMDSSKKVGANSEPSSPKKK